VSPQRKALVVIVIAAILGISLINALALTPKEREKAKKVLEAVEMAGEHIKALQSAAEAANLSAQLANDSAGSAWSSAFQVGLTAKKAQEEAERCQKENARMRPIVDAVTGPWWFPGGKALIYGAKKSLLSLVGRDVERGPWRRHRNFRKARAVVWSSRQTSAFIFPTTGQECRRQHQTPNHRTRR
jgi:type II secretory pathway pseudopilin PulG